MIRIKTGIYSFSELSLEELYQALQLRSEVFVVEQNCNYQDLDGKDENSRHILIHNDNHLIAYARLYAGMESDTWHIGRVVVRKEWRSKGWGKNLVKLSVEYLFEKPEVQYILISAQKHLLRFYTDLGFEHSGREYLEDGIPHVAMKMSKKKPTAP